MTFDDILAQVLELLQREGRVSYRALKLRFDINDDYIEGIKDELIYAKKLAMDKEQPYPRVDLGTKNIPTTSRPVHRRTSCSPNYRPRARSPVLHLRGVGFFIKP